MWICKICSGEWETIPDHAVLLNKRGMNHVYRFSDKTVHSLYQARPMTAQARHTRWHKASKQIGCEFCFPPTKPEPQPEPPVELLQVVQVLEKLPDPNIEEIKSEVVAEFEPELTTALAIAFRRRKQIQN